MRFKKNRLKLMRDIEKVMKLGEMQRIFDEKRNEVFLVRYYPHEGYSRFTVIVPKKVARKSVWRNRIKRITREAFRQMIKDGKAPNYDIIFIARQNIYQKKAPEIKKILESFFGKIQSK